MAARLSALAASSALSQAFDFVNLWDRLIVGQVMRGEGGWGMFGRMALVPSVGEIKV